MQNKRASQFQPFDALTGLKKALRERERIVVPKVDLSVDELELLNFKMKQVKVGNVVSLVHFDKDEYIKTFGMVTKVDLSAKYISIVKTKISFKNIIDVCGDCITSME